MTDQCGIAPVNSNNLIPVPDSDSLRQLVVPNWYWLPPSSKMAAPMFDLVYTVTADGNVPVTKYRSKKTGLTVFIAQVEGPLVNGYFCLGKNHQFSEAMGRKYICGQWSIQFRNPGRFARGLFRRVVSPWVVSPLFLGWVVSPVSRFALGRFAPIYYKAHTDIQIRQTGWREGGWDGNKTFRPQDVSPPSRFSPSRFASIFNPSHFAPHTLVVSPPLPFPPSRFAPKYFSLFIFHSIFY